ncbi:MAG TPA: MFS transporter [Thermoanaerobaculia bacterium]|nr:MFS transporter [Thermoanaerobaculia bacterium]
MPERQRFLATARGALTVLTLINLLNYLDRYVVSALVESLRRSELHLSDFQLGSLVTAFVVVYMAASPIFGVMGDRRSRPPLLGIGVALWSVATAAGGLARSFAALFAARSAVGVGEASYGAIAPALLADAFPAERRGRVFAVFFCAIPVGSALGYVLGGWMDLRFGWRAAFLLAGVPGLFLAFLAARLPDPPRRDDPGGPASPVSRQSAASRFAAIARIPNWRRAVVGYAAYTFALGALAFWTPAFLERVRGVPRSQATVLFGAIAVVTGFTGTFAGGWLGDRLLRRSRQAYLWVSGGTTLAAAPIALVAFTSSSKPVYLAAIVVSETLLFMSTGPVNSAIVNAVPADRRASAVALSTFAIHLFGDVPSPPLLGAISDATSLASAFLLVPAVIAAAGIVWLWAAARGAR